MTSITFCLLDAANRNNSATGSITEPLSRRMARMRSASGVPPGSFVTTTFFPRSRNVAARRLSWVVLPEPSMPSNVMNIGARFYWERRRPRRLVRGRPARPAASRRLPGRRGRRRSESVAESAQVMLAHQRLEHLRPCEQAEALAEVGAAAQFGERALVGERSLRQLVHAEEVAELGVLAVE